MGTGLSTLRDRVEAALGDSSNEIFSTAEIDAALQEALRELSLDLPIRVVEAVTTTANDRDIDISGLAQTVLRVTAVELPTGSHPREFRWYESNIEGEVRILDDPAPDGSNANIYYDALHVLNGSQTLPVRYDPILVAGAARNAALSRSGDITHEIPTGGPNEPKTWQDLARHFEPTWNRRKPLRGIRTRRMYAPHEPTARQDSDPGP